MNTYTATTHYRGRPLGTYVATARTKADAALEIQLKAARGNNLTRNESAFIRVEFT